MQVIRFFESPGKSLEPKQNVLVEVYNFAHCAKNLELILERKFISW